jgi:Zn-finger nucleic acid-binding protein
LPAADESQELRPISGVLVDICKPHGIWFDSGELGRIIRFGCAAVSSKPGIASYRSSIAM